MEQQETHLRDPCPWRILDDCGGAFAMGCIGGTIWHAVKGARNAPQNQRFIGSLSAVKARAPVLGGNFAVWGGLFSTFDCTLIYMRQKDDPWNSIMSGAATGGVLAARSGWKMSLQSAAFGGIVLGAIEGLGILINRMSTQSAMPEVMAELPPDPLAPMPRSNAV
eukprot:m.153580 g.153580  ORF g.153580 m.153580 type:complete len:165 (-) comp24595_c0_seq2:34-528(-)